MNTIIFKNGVAFYSEGDINENTSDEELLPLDSLAEYLNCAIKLKPDTTLAHIWSYLERDSEFFGKVFRQAMGSFSFDSYIEQSKKSDISREDEDPQDRIEYLELGWYGEIYDDQIDIFIDFGGVGPHKCGDTGNVIPDTGWAVEMTPINELLHYPLKLSDKIIFHNEKYETILEGKRDWTVYDVFYGILFEITFCGTPVDQIRKGAELDQLVAEAKDSLKKLSKKP